MDTKKGNKQDNNKKAQNIISNNKEFNYKKNLIIIAVIIAVSVFLFIFSARSVVEKYTNKIHGYSFEFIPDAYTKVVVEDNIPDGLKKQGIKTMKDLQLTESDVLILKGNPNTNQTTVYTIAEISKRTNYKTYTNYITALRASLDTLSTGASTTQNFTYNKKEIMIGKTQIPAIQFLSEMEVMRNPQITQKETGIFYDTVFQVNDKAYLISMRYLKDNKNSQDYVNFYNNILTSFSY